MSNELKKEQALIELDEIQIDLAILTRAFTLIDTAVEHYDQPIIGLPEQIVGKGEEH